MRLFLAVVLSKEMKNALTAAMGGMKAQGVRGRYVPAANLHLTLAFLGEVEDPEPVKAAMSGVAFSPFPLSLDRLGTFGDLLWAGLRGETALTALARDLRAALDGAGISYDRKRFSPHITLVRRMSGPWERVRLPRSEMRVERFVLMESRAVEGRRVYTELFSVPAKGGEAL